MSDIKVVMTDSMGSDLKVCQMAKDSFGRTTDWEPDGSLSAKDQRLLKMLARGMGEAEYTAMMADPTPANMWRFKHTTPHLAPFGHNFATFQFQAPVFVMRQIVKHEYLRLSELSMRYVRDMPEYFRPKSWRSVADDVKQGSGGDIIGVPAHMLYKHLEDCEEYDGDEYRIMTHKDGIAGLAPEQARMFLRLCHMTQGHISGSMDAFANLVIQRLDPHAQEETREFARQIDAAMGDRFPLSWAALMEGVSRT